MLLKEMTKQMRNLGNVNGQSNWGYKELDNYICKYLEKHGEEVPMTIDLPDGTWMMVVGRWKEKNHYEYYYVIPETREEEKKMWKKFRERFKEGGTQNGFD